MSPTIKITDAGNLVQRVQIGDETVSVGKNEEVSDDFVSRLKDEFPHFEFEEDPAEEEGPATTSEQQPSPLSSGSTDDQEASGR